MLKAVQPSIRSVSTTQNAGVSLSHMLEGSSILIVEDEYLLADALARRFEGVGAVVIGPTGTVKGSIEHMSRIGVVSAALLDIRLGRELVFPVADVLAARSVPFVFYTSYDDISLPTRFRNSRRLSKVAGLDDVVMAVLAERAMAEATAKEGLFDVATTDLPILLPRLRLMGRLLTHDAETGDDLVASALERAISSTHSLPYQTSLLRWLLMLVEQAWLASIRGKPN